MRRNGTNLPICTKLTQFHPYWVGISYAVMLSKSLWNCSSCTMNTITTLFKHCCIKVHCSFISSMSSSFCWARNTFIPSSSGWGKCAGVSIATFVERRREIFTIRTKMNTQGDDEEDSGPSVDSVVVEERIAARRLRIQRRIEAAKRFVNSVSRAFLYLNWWIVDV